MKRKCPRFLFHQAYFTNSEAQNTGRIIAQNFDKKITWAGIKTLSKRDKIGIKDSFELSEKMLCILDIKNQIEELNQQLANNKRHSFNTIALIKRL